MMNDRKDTIMKKTEIEMIPSEQTFVEWVRNDQEMTIDQIATATGHPKSSIKATISQARKTMKELLDKISKWTENTEKYW